jgi:tetratricopeptide (TPR) repeat protein
VTDVRRCGLRRVRRARACGQIHEALRYTYGRREASTIRDCALLAVKFAKTGFVSAHNKMGRGVQLAAGSGRSCAHAWFAAVCVLLCLIVCTLLCQPVFAQPDAQAANPNLDLEARNTTMARALFDEGLKYVDAEQWEQAQDRFARVLSLRYSAVAQYNYGLASARLGRSVVAASALRRLLTDVNLDPHVHEHAASLLRDVEARFAWLNVRVQGECEGCEVVLNEQLWPWAAIGVFVPVDAGSYALRLRLGSNVLAEQRLSIAASERLEATLSSGHPGSLAASNAAGAHAGDPAFVGAPPQPGEPRKTNLLRSGWFWGAVGVIAVGAAGMVMLTAH